MKNRLVPAMAQRHWTGGRDIGSWSLSRIGARQASPPSWPTSRIPIVALGASLSLFLSITFTLNVLHDLWFPEQATHPAWMRLLPGFTWISWPSFFLGLGECFAFGWYVAVVFGLLFNFFARRRARSLE